MGLWFATVWVWLVSLYACTLVGTIVCVFVCVFDRWSGCVCKCASVAIVCVCMSRRAYVCGRCVVSDCVCMVVRVCVHSCAWVWLSLCLSVSWMVYWDVCVCVR